MINKNQLQIIIFFNVQPFLYYFIWYQNIYTNLNTNKMNKEKSYKNITNKLLIKSKTLIQRQIIY